MPFDSCPSNVRFRFLLPENCHSAYGQLRTFGRGWRRSNLSKTEVAAHHRDVRFPPKRTRLSRLSVHALVHDRLDLHDDLVGDNGVSVMSREGSGGIRDDRVDCNRELMAGRLNFRNPDLTCAPSNPEYQLMAKRVAHRVPKPWTKQDVRELKTHSRARTPVVKVSKSMKRTVGALRRRAGILGIGLGHRR